MLSDTVILPQSSLLHVVRTANPMSRRKTMTDRFLRLPEVKKLSGMSRSTIYLRIAEGLYPRPIQLGTRMVGWRESEVATMNAARVRGATVNEIRELVVCLQAERKKVA